MFFNFGMLLDVLLLDDVREVANNPLYAELKLKEGC